LQQAEHVDHVPVLGHPAALKAVDVDAGRPRDAPARQRRMRDTIAWSYDQLMAEDRVLFRRLSVCAGSWSLDGAESVCAGAASPGAVLDGLRSLVDNSLVVPLDTTDGEPRYRMLDTICEYGAEQLAGDLDHDEVGRRHAEHHLRLAEAAKPALQGSEQGAWLRRLEREHANPRAALAWLLGAGEVERALLLAGAVWRYWQRRGDLREGLRWLAEGLERAGRAPAAVMGKALWGAIWLAYQQGDHRRARALSTSLLGLARECGDAMGTRNALTGLGIVAMAEGRFAEALPPLREALDICRPLGETWQLATSCLNLGVASQHVGEYERARELIEEARALHRERGGRVFAAQATQYLGYVALRRGDGARAAGLVEEGLRALQAEGEQLWIADALETVAGVRAATGRPREAARLCAAAERLREDAGAAPLAFVRALWEPHVAEAAGRLGEAEWRAAWDEGKAMTAQQAVAAALGETAGERFAAGETGPRPASKEAGRTHRSCFSPA
jgi:non-specific serine/threonine protein kinase